MITHHTRSSITHPQSLFHVTLEPLFNLRSSITWFRITWRPLIMRLQPPFFSNVLFSPIFDSVAYIYTLYPSRNSNRMRTHLSLSPTQPKVPSTRVRLSLQARAHHLACLHHAARIHTHHTIVRQRRTCWSRIILASVSSFFFSSQFSLLRIVLAYLPL